MDITLKYQSLYETVSRSLSIIGKRSVDDHGNLLFKDITLGTREQLIITDYFRQAVTDLSAELAPLIAVPGTQPGAALPGEAQQGAVIPVSLPPNHNPSLEGFIQQSCEDYCVSYALYSWLYITAPRIAPRYLDDCKRQLAAVVRMAYDKTQPKAASSSYADVDGSVIRNT